ncbi:MAG: YqaJ viral recombinase family protein [Candidatus Hodarchaeota archaeon]
MKNQFLKERQSGIGGSDVASLIAMTFPALGLKPFKTPLEIYYSKILEPEEHKATIAQKRGQNAESLVAEIYAQKKNVKIVEKKQNLFFRHKKYDFMIAHPDRFCSELKAKDEWILECKTVHHANSNKWETDMPQEYFLQCAHYAIVCDVPFVDIAGMIGFEGMSGDDNFFKIYTYIREKQFEKKLIEIEEKFWEEHVLKKIPPQPITLSDTNLLYNPEKALSVIATQEIENDFNSYLELGKQKAELEKKQKEKLLHIKNFMGNAYTLKSKHGEELAINYKRTSTQIDKNKLKEVVSEDLYKSLVKESSSLTFRAKRAIS